MRINKVICDKCKKEINKDAKGIALEVLTNGIPREVFFDLCSDCLQELGKMTRKFIKGETTL